MGIDFQNATLSYRWPLHTEHAQWEHCLYRAVGMGYKYDCLLLLLLLSFYF